jgi:hypothetical protein
LLFLVVVVDAALPDVIELQLFSANSFVVDIKGAISIMADVDIVAGMAIVYGNIPRVTYARK